MNEKEKELKAFNQCADALSSLDNKSIFKVFQLLSVHFEFMPATVKAPELPHPQDQKHLPQPKAFDIHLELESSKEKSKTSTVKIKKAKTGLKEPTYLTDFDFRPNGFESLKDFYGRYKSANNFENNLIFAYYLQEIVKIQNISVNHIYSCYRILNIKIPLFPQTLIDTKNRKGYIENSDYNDLKVTRTGINFMTHDMVERNN